MGITAKKALVTFTGGLVASLFAMGCSASTEEGVSDAPDLESDGIEVQQLITNANSDGTWTANASAGYTYYLTWLVSGGATFTGPAGKTRKMGACLIQRYYPDTTCTAGDDGVPTGGSCNSAPTTLPSGGSRYCVAPNGSGQKYCHYRPGASANYCAGTPATGSPVGPGTYNAIQPATYGSKWVSYACFEGCGAFAPTYPVIAGSVSTTTTIGL